MHQIYIVIEAMQQNLTKYTIDKQLSEQFTDADTLIKSIAWGYNHMKNYLYFVSEYGLEKYVGKSMYVTVSAIMKTPQWYTCMK